MNYGYLSANMPYCFYSNYINNTKLKNLIIYRDESEYGEEGYWGDEEEKDIELDMELYYANSDYSKPTRYIGHKFEDIENEVPDLHMHSSPAGKTEQIILSMPIPKGMDDVSLGNFVALYNENDDVCLDKLIMTHSGTVEQMKNIYRADNDFPFGK